MQKWEWDNRMKMLAILLQVGGYSHSYSRPDAEFVSTIEE